MPRKKLKKSTGDEPDVGEDESQDKEFSKNGIEWKSGKGLIVDDAKVDCADSNSIHSKSSGVSVTIKKRFSFAKRKKSVDRHDKISQEDTGSTKRGMRLTNSLNNVRQDTSTSKLPILKYKLKHVDSKPATKHELCPKPGKCESRSLVLNPGMDSWRMAGLMDTVSTNSMQTLRSMNPLSDQQHKPPSVALSSSLSKNRGKSLEKVKDDRPYSYTPGVSPMVIVREKSDPVGNTFKHNQMNGFSDKNSNELPEADEMNTNNELLDAQSSNNIENDVKETSLTYAPYDSHQERKEQMNEPFPDLVVVTESINNEPVNKDEITEDIFCAGVRPEGCTSSNNDCSVIPDPSYAKAVPVVSVAVNGEIGQSFAQDLYELDGENIISVRELKDFIDENQIQLPKSVSCDDWLVLDFFHSALASL